MSHRVNPLLITAGLLIACVDASAVQAAPPIRALLITGHNNHNWRYTSRLHADTLEATGRFAVTISDEPEITLADGDRISGYEVFVLDYNDYGDPKRWGDAAEANFLDAVRRGTGVVAIHSANNAFNGWTEYERMLGLMWREGTGHGRFHRFDVKFIDRDHPITRGLADFQDHPDELYHRLVNSQSAPLHLLATAFSSKESGGTGEDEPLALTLQYGEGRVFATPLGHVWTNAPETKISITNPDFRILLCRGAEWAATGNVTLGTQWRDVRSHNTLSERERAEGWTLLFDGESTQHFRGFRQDAFPQRGWHVGDGALCVEAGGGGDIVTVEQFGDFEFTCQWKATPGGNSGIIYRVSEEHDQTWHTGPEMQILDDAAHRNADPRTRAGAMYGLFRAQYDVVRPAGEWNEARIIARGSKIEHWLNGFKVVECDLESDEFQRRRAESKFAGITGFAASRRGHIALQDHGDEVCFRAIKVRRLD